MRHVLSILLQNESGALARVSAMFANRGFNIESLNVAPTEDESVSRLTLVTSGADVVIAQVSKQLAKLIDVVAIADRTESAHLERELGLLKLRAAEGGAPGLRTWAAQSGGRVLDEDPAHFIVEIAGTREQLDRLLHTIPPGIQLLSLVRSGPLVISKGPHVLGSYGRSLGTGGSGPET